MVYLFIGQETEAKEKEIALLKSSLLKDKDAKQFDYENLQAHKLHANALKQSLDALPVIGQQRFVVIREVEKLDKHNKDLILEYVERKEEHHVLLLDAFKADSKTSFFKKMNALATVKHFDKGYRENTFDITKAISSRQPAKALKILDDVLKHGDHPLQILGALVWFWGKNKPRVSVGRFQRGLDELQEADLNIKRSRLKPEHTLEILVVKLCSLVT
jgi:DNA polymerase III delta subunit